MDVFVCAIVLLQHIYLESVEVKSLYKVDVVPVLIAKIVLLQTVKIILSEIKYIYNKEVKHSNVVSVVK